eukprot:TRINITY_DN10471_c0_g1_i1.p1 TRINITY_DN10471_c0_g1~~TRINITY_DN10471_c0_g1_i1.p1  ORF type:complete len:220 (-),score=34.21 TRINITY_DN10471_c0_g1_i1:560-1219(-)
MTTYLPEQIPELISSNPTVSLGSIKYKATSGNGGCKELLVDGEVISIVVPCETRKLETSHRFKVVFIVTKEIYDFINPLCRYISNSLGADMRPFCWEYNKEGSSKVNYYVSGKLLSSKTGDMYTKLYSEDGILIEDINSWPSGYVGHASLRLDGVYIDNLKSRDAKISFVVTVEEMLISEMLVDSSGSKIKKLLYTDTKETKQISIDHVPKENSSEDLW